MRRLDLVSAGQQAVPAALRLAHGSGHGRAIALPGQAHNRFQEVQPFADRGAAGGLHGGGSEGAEPSAAGSVGSADGAAVLGSEGCRTREGGSQGKEGGECLASAAAAESYAINLGATP